MRYVCQACGAESPKWAGQCADCGAWNTLIESAGEATTPDRRAAIAGEARIERLHEVETEDAPRVASGLPEMDRVLGGGIVPEKTAVFIIKQEVTELAPTREDIARMEEKQEEAQ